MFVFETKVYYRCRAVQSSLIVARVIDGERVMDG